MREAQQRPANTLNNWSTALAYSAFATSILLGLFYYWFAVANRCVIFLYGHLGASPFDARTTSRYLMSGLVAAGVLLVAITVINWGLGRFIRAYHPPPWWQQWILCSPPIAVGVYLIATRCNAPTLPPLLGARVVLATLAALPLAFVPGTLAARDPRELVWLVCAGVGIAAVLLLFRAIELPASGLLEPTRAYLTAIGGTVIGVLWTSAFSRWHTRQRGQAWAPHQLVLAGMSISYLLMPLLHYLLLVPPDYRYVSTADNFFAGTLGTQMVTLLIAVGASFSIAKIQHTRSPSSEGGAE